MSAPGSSITSKWTPFNRLHVGKLHVEGRKSQFRLQRGDLLAGSSQFILHLFGLLRHFLHRRLERRGGLLEQS